MGLSVNKNLNVVRPLQTAERVTVSVPHLAEHSVADIRDDDVGHAKATTRVAILAVGYRTPLAVNAELTIFISGHLVVLGCS